MEILAWVAALVVPVAFLALVSVEAVLVPVSVVVVLALVSVVAVLVPVSVVVVLALVSVVAVLVLTLLFARIAERPSRLPEPVFSREPAAWEGSPANHAPPGIAEEPL